jgi:tetratricopeptide (TPR) repeat protein
MYQLYHGISLYEVERRRVRDPDPSSHQLDAARDALAAAIKIAPELWRAHYYLGRIYRDLDDPRRAAQQFTATIKLHPGYRFGYIALIELYRAWDYVDQALAVSTLGTAQLPSAETAELWFEVGMAHDAKSSGGQGIDSATESAVKKAIENAIDAFGRAITINPGDTLSKLQRGELYLRRRDFVNARRDLEDVLRSPDPRAASAKPLVSWLLGQIESGRDASLSRDARWDCRHIGDAIACRPRSR